MSSNQTMFQMESAKPVSVRDLAEKMFEQVQSVRRGLPESEAIHSIELALHSIVKRHPRVALQILLDDEIPEIILAFARALEEANRLKMSAHYYFVLKPDDFDKRYIDLIRLIEKAAAQNKTRIAGYIMSLFLDGTDYECLEKLEPEMNRRIRSHCVDIMNKSDAREARRQKIVSKFSSIEVDEPQLLAIKEPSSILQEYVRKIVKDVY